ncbi:Pimeloyl-ACP methyl ester carboxylesterase [Evansella caseinilytica]|uniref:Pimeloyl-ACP methyl ester carboxylesterase n=1 Tax=Evansella caseinilytica TaxID=1503961 RepID=A0A1H3QA02_9BACI|nr:alpha/beta hydrolase [Evansella caseinilytica]SDZ10187.1 Pimeloyl-ACP methyl ester carboxylesterase [Evansella caseinilytica]
MIYPVIISSALLAGISFYLQASMPALPEDADPIIDEVLTNELPEVVSGRTGYAVSNGLKIWYECISPEAPLKGTVLLLMGIGADAFIWPKPFIQALVRSGYQVIRYDHRGTGMSDRVEDWSFKNPYSLKEMADDAVAVLDSLKVREAFVVGFSMGGMIAQEMTIHHPARVSSLTLMMTSGNIRDAALPGPTPGYFLQHFVKSIHLLKYRIGGREKNLIKEYIVKQIAEAGGSGIDIKAAAEECLYCLRNRKSNSLKAGLLQHLAAIRASGSRCEKLTSLNIPTLIVHGTDDQLIPIAHGKKLAETIPNAKSLWLEGVGHIFPVPDMDVLLEKMLIHFQHWRER